MLNPETSSTGYFKASRLRLEWSLAPMLVPVPSLTSRVLLACMTESDQEPSPSLRLSLVFHSLQYHSNVPERVTQLPFLSVWMVLVSDTMGRQ